MLNVNRRRFLMFAAPAIVAAPSLMRISAAFLMPDEAWDIDAMAAEAERQIAKNIRFGVEWKLPDSHLASARALPPIEPTLPPTRTWGTEHWKFLSRNGWKV